MRKALARAETPANKIKLADHLFKLHKFEEAASYYKSAKTGFLKDDFELKCKIILSLSPSLDDTEEIISIGEPYEDDPKFQAHPAFVEYAYAYFANYPEDAFFVLEKINKSNRHHSHRVYYLELLTDMARCSRASALANELEKEFAEMREGQIDDLDQLRLRLSDARKVLREIIADNDCMD